MGLNMPPCPSFSPGLSRQIGLPSLALLQGIRPPNPRAKRQSLVIRQRLRVNFYRLVRDEQTEACRNKLPAEVLQRGHERLHSQQQAQCRGSKHRAQRKTLFQAAQV